MYTIILLVGNTNDISRYDFWLQDFENAGLGRILYSNDLEEETADKIVRIVRGRDRWSLIMVRPKPDSRQLNIFLNKIKVSVRQEKNYLVHMPEKIWILVNRYGLGETRKLGREMNLITLPSNCRILEYVIELEDRECWIESLELLCIVLLFSMNSISSENFVVYKSHRVKVEIDIDKLRQYNRYYRDVFRQGMERAQYISSVISEKTVERDQEVLQDRPTAIMKVEDTTQYIDKWRKKRLDRDKAYYDMKNNVNRQKRILAWEVKRRADCLHVVEKELSQEDVIFVSEKKQQEEIEMISLMTDMDTALQRLENKRITAEQKRSGAVLLYWGMEEGFKIISCSFGAALFMIFATLFETGKIVGIGKDEILSMLAVTLIFAFLMGAYFLFYNVVRWYASKNMLKKVSQDIKRFEMVSREKSYRFALLCCRIRKHQMILLGHRFALNNKKDKIKNTEMHYDFCKKRLAKLVQWDRLLAGNVKSVQDNEKTAGVIVPNMDVKPEYETIYNMIYTLEMREIPVNESGQTIQCPFPFVKKLMIEREFYQ